MKKEQLEAIDKRYYYRVRGNMLNGHTTNEAGVRVPFVEKAEYTRRVKSWDLDKGRMYLECGRVYIIDDDLKLDKMDY